MAWHDIIICSARTCSCGGFSSGLPRDRHRGRSGVSMPFKAFVRTWWEPSQEPRPGASPFSLCIFFPQKMTPCLPAARFLLLFALLPPSPSRPAIRQRSLQFPIYLFLHLPLELPMAIISWPSPTPPRNPFPPRSCPLSPVPFISPRSPPVSAFPPLNSPWKPFPRRSSRLPISLRFPGPCRHLGSLS